MPNGARLFVCLGEILFQVGFKGKPKGNPVRHVGCCVLMSNFFSTLPHAEWRSFVCLFGGDPFSGWF